MIIPLPALVAYRRDVESLSRSLASAPEVEHALEQGLAFALMLESAVAPDPSSVRDGGADDVEDARQALGRRLFDLAEDRGLAGDVVASMGDAGIASIAALTRRVADRAEQRGALWIAYAMLAMLERLGDVMPPLELGRVLAQRARVARKADSSDIAEALYKRVDALGRTAGLPELTARAAVGFGVLAQVRGNLPLAARHFGKAARLAARVGDADLLYLAQHGRMVIAAKRGTFADALSFGWEALATVAGNSEEEADMLLNLAQIAFDTGHPGPALQGFAAALARRPGPHLLLPAIGGAARAAAALNRTGIVRSCGARIDEFAHEGSFAYPIASALLDLALATATTEPTLAERYVLRALRLTGEFHFHELEHHLLALQSRLQQRMEPPSGLVPPSRSVGTRGKEILRQIEQLDGDLLQAAT